MKVTSMWGRFLSVLTSTALILVGFALFGGLRTAWAAEHLPRGAGAPLTVAPADDEPVNPNPTKGGAGINGVTYAACPPRFMRGVSEAVIKAALEDPSAIYGYGMCANPSLPCSVNSLQNSPRRWLVPGNPNKPYHSLTNSLQFKAGCY